MCFHHVDGFFNIPVFVGVKDCLMFVVNLCLDAGFLYAPVLFDRGCSRKESKRHSIKCGMQEKKREEQDGRI